MPVICFDENNFRFPPVEEADEEGLLVIGGRVTPERVIEAYQKGIFPWYSDESLPLWWSPDPRFVLFPDELHVSKSMKKVLSRNTFQFRMNTAFGEVINHCATVNRKGQDGTWITQNMKKTYIQLNKTGYALSAEAWEGNKLVGGMYGIRIGRVFFAESMFSAVTNASKFAFIRYVEYLKYTGIGLIDCQVYTEHVESLGARLIGRSAFLDTLRELV